MRNLKLVHTCHIPAVQDLACSHDISIDPDTGRIILITATTVVALDPLSQQVTHRKSLLSDAVLSVKGHGYVVGLQYLPDQGGACLATANGNLVLWTLDINELECVGSVDSGLTTMQWSPDQELLVLTTGADSLIVMTREFDAITEVPLHSSDFGEGEFMAVGWGKKETQFHGSEGKQAAHQRKEDIPGTVPWDDGRPRVRWRGDGHFFAISCINKVTASRYIRVWSRDGVLQSTSEPVNGLEQALFWKPSGALIASTQRKPHKHDVIFFEKNGLQHGEFTLASGKEEFKVLEVLWNLDSSILAVWCQHLLSGAAADTASQPPSFVQLWTSSNYQWFLKQTLAFDSVHGNVSALTWDPEQAGRLHVVTSEGHYLQYTWTWVTSRSLGQTSCDPTNVFVINGSNLNVTPMRTMIVPPPWSAYQLPLPASAAQVVSPASPAEDTGNVGVLTHDNQFLVFCHNSKASADKVVAKLGLAAGVDDGFLAPFSTPLLHAVYRLVLPDGVSQFPLCVTHVCWPRGGLLVFCIHGRAGIFLSTVHLPQDSSEEILRLGAPVAVEGDVISLSVNPVSADSVAVQLSTGAVLRFTLDDEMLSPWETASGKELYFPFPCTQMEVSSFSGEEAVLGLTDRFRFYVNGTEVASNCSSFAVHDEFVLLTTLEHKLRCISRHATLKDLPSLSDGTAHQFDESLRRMERGARIVAVVAEDTKLIVQMPRGNLESIQPRSLMLAAVQRLLDKCEFDLAFSIMKKQSMNLNLLYDHNPTAFLQNIAKFVQQISDVADINLFLRQLEEEDVTMTMYSAAYKRSSTVTPASSAASMTLLRSIQPGKVDTVCDAVRQVLELQGADRYRLALLTTYVKKREPQLQKALEMVWQLKATGEKGDGVSAEEALKSLLVMVDVNKLYDAALATYNFDLVLMVAEKSQKDPKEYIPFLNQLRQLDDNYCKFTIDSYLKNYTSALQHIVLCDADHFSECVDLVQEHKLYVEALKLFSTDSFEFKTLALEYGHYLREKNRHEEAGLVFLRAEYWQMAHDAFVAALNWRQAMCMASHLQFADTHMADTARSLAVRLKDNKRYSEAAVLFEHYAKDVEEAIVTLIEGAEWEEALRLMYSHGRTDIIETHLKGAISEASQETMATLENQQSEMEHHVARLAIVREEKERRRQALWADTEGHDNMNADLFSETSSMTGESIPASQYTVDSNRSTVFSKVSGRSSRNRRKAEHKKWSLKEGSPFEDCALIDAIAKIITATDTMRDEVNALLHVLTQFHQVAAGEQLQQQYEGFLALIQRVIPLVWVQEESSSMNSILGPGMTANAIAQAVQLGRTLDGADRTEPVLLVPPTMKKDVRWKLHMLQTSEK